MWRPRIIENDSAWSKKHIPGFDDAEPAPSSAPVPARKGRTVLLHPPDDRVSAARLVNRIAALAAALDDLPGQEELKAAGLLDARSQPPIFRPDEPDLPLEPTEDEADEPLAVEESPTEPGR